MASINTVLMRTGLARTRGHDYWAELREFGVSELA
jgi:hypothetical protein